LTYGGNLDDTTLFRMTTSGVFAVVGTVASSKIMNYGLGDLGDANTEYIEMYHTGGNAVIDSDATGSGAAADLILATGGTPKLTIVNSTGNVGIGVVDPDSPLEILSTSTQLKLSYDGDIYGTIESTADGILRLTTSGTYIDFAGVMNFQNAAYGLPYAGIYADDNADFTVLAAQDTWYQVTIFSANETYLDAVPDHTNDHITITSTGVYHITASISSWSAQANDYYYAVFKNNGATELSNLEARRQTDAASTPGSVSISGRVSLTAADTIELWVKRTDGGASSKNLTIDHVNLGLNYIAG